MALTSAAHAELCRLRRDIARMEGRPAEEGRLVWDATRTVCALSGVTGGSVSGTQDAEPNTSGAIGAVGAEPNAAGMLGLDGAASETTAVETTAGLIAETAQETTGPLSLAPRARRGRLKLGAARLDAALGGGLPLAALHDIRADESRDGGAAAGFVLALAAQLAKSARLTSTEDTQTIVWISEADLRRQTGRLHAPGLAALGLDPARVMEVTARTKSEALWAFEAALDCPAVSVAVCELRQVALDLAVTRRCALRARDRGVTGFLMRLASPPEPSAAEMRFAISPAPAGTIGGFAAGIGRMAWRLTLEKNRNGPTGAFSVEWTSHERRFVEPNRSTEPGEGDAHAYPQSLPAAPVDRSVDPAAIYGGRMRFRYAS